MNTTLSNLQLELLKTFSVHLGEEQLIEIKSLLSGYFAKKATDEMNSLFEENQWGLEKINEWRNSHLRAKS